MTGAVIRASEVTAVRYERSRPGELVHMDVKKPAPIPDGGWRTAAVPLSGFSARRARVARADL